MSYNCITCIFFSVQYVADVDKYWKSTWRALSADWIIASRQSGSCREGILTICYLCHFSSNVSFARAVYLLGGHTKWLTPYEVKKTVGGTLIFAMFCDNNSVLLCPITASCVWSLTPFRKITNTALSFATVNFLISRPWLYVK